MDGMFEGHGNGCMRMESGGLRVCRYEDVGCCNRRCDKQKADNGPSNRMFVIHLR